jgi:competence protein ComGC
MSKSRFNAVGGAFGLVFIVLVALIASVVILGTMHLASEKSEQISVGKNAVVEHDLKIPDHSFGKIYHAEPLPKELP